MEQVQKGGVVGSKDSAVVGFERGPIYGKFSIFLLGVIFITVMPHYSKISSPSEAVSLNFIVHAALYLGWYILLSVQCNFVQSGRLNFHRKLGYASIVFFVLLQVSGIEMLIDVMRSNNQFKLSLIWGILHTILFFSAFYLAALIARKDVHAHKRLMLLASLSMISASVTRVAYLPGVPIDGTALVLLSTYGLLVAPVLMDRFKFGAVHPVFKWGIPLYISTQIICIAIMPGTELGKLIAFPFSS
ncbi:hypothetical protein KUV22_16850 [Microbulbifer agarilyticus]|uniref:hypothetical protein n=1 Tax=Microbulbifer agarilyticus TaxID=260552 RepID=UPI001C945BEC|nr:hypothetical protein [Microbulbifer agarilyticus]MBY6192095.1 hypothetical protein [Microbulbifer agarilyticus]